MPLPGWIFFAVRSPTVTSIARKDALRAYYQSVFAKGFNLTWSATHAEVSGQHAQISYVYYQTKSRTTISHGIYITVSRNGDGCWKVVLILVALRITIYAHN